jgi:MYXO-CTERM domain-containing protein
MNGDISQGGTGVITGALVEKNVIYSNGAGGGSGINCDGVQASVIRNNLIYDEHASGISLYQIDAAQPAFKNVVVNNTIVVAADGRWALNIKNGSTGNSAYNNILLNLNPAHGSIDIAADSLVGFSSDYNVVVDLFTPDDGTTFLSQAMWQAQTGQDAHSFIATAAALFVGNGDYHLSATSPAIDKGTSSDAPSDDLDGNARPQGNGWDIGAYEYCTGGTCAVAPPDMAATSDLSSAAPPGDMAATGDLAMGKDIAVQSGSDLARATDGAGGAATAPGCSCQVGGRDARPQMLLAAVLVLLMLARRAIASN